MSERWDVKVASAEAAFEALQSLLEGLGYEHEGWQLEVPPDPARGVAGFSGRITGMRDSPRRDLAYLIFGILLLPTIIETGLGIKFLRQSRYYFRTLATISVEGEAVVEPAGMGVTLDVAGGVAQGESDIVRPTDNKRELALLGEEQRRMSSAVSALLEGMAPRDGQRPGTGGGEEEHG